jgi:DNA topoisomerase-1
VESRERELLEGEVCPQCGGNLEVRYSARGKFAGCANYPECDYTRDLSGLPERAEPEAIDEKCPECGKELLRREGRRGPFIGCSGFPECRYTRPLEGEAEEEEAEGLEIGPEEKCPECAAELVVKRGRRGPFVGCSAYPDCNYIRGAKGRRQKKTVKTDWPCEECGKNLVLRSGRRGQFLGCSGFPRCRFTREVTEEELSTLEVKEENSSS